MALRFGLLGTGHWAAETHAPALVESPDAELVGVWGRNPAKAEGVAVRHGARPYDDLDDLLADVEAVAIALPPDVQAELALRAARAGRHLLLDKPVALTTAAADALLAAVEERGLSSVVFFTSRFRPAVDAFLRDAAAAGDWGGGRGTVFASIFRPGSPYGDSRWRVELGGGLWDVGPYALSHLLPVLGPVREVAAMTASPGTTQALLRHDSGVASVLSVTVDAPAAATAYEVVFWGERGWAGVPSTPSGPGVAVGALGVAIADLTRDAATARTDHPCGVRFGRDVVAVLEAVETASRTGRTVPVATR